MPSDLTQTSAPVSEFRCLYTFNITQKKKKWQDGLLKFHSRNNRVIVYDTTSNYIGDGHWQGNDVLCEGDELDLHCGALIQVSELIRTTTTDLTPLLERKRKADGDCANGSRTTISHIHSQDPSKRHKSLRSILQSQNVIAARPFAGNDENIHPRNSTPWNITSVVKNPMTSVSGKKKPNNFKKTVPTRPSQGKLPIKHIIDLVSDSSPDLPVVKESLTRQRPSSPPIDSVSSPCNADKSATTSGTSTKFMGKPLRLAKTKDKKKLLCIQSKTISALMDRKAKYKDAGPSIDVSIQRCENVVDKNEMRISTSLSKATSRPIPAITAPDKACPLSKSAKYRTNSEQRDHCLDITLEDSLPLPSSLLHSSPVKQAFQQPDNLASYLGPWSTEALDLFDWRPPDWEIRKVAICDRM